MFIQSTNHLYQISNSVFKYLNTVNKNTRIFFYSCIFYLLWGTIPIAEV